MSNVIINGNQGRFRSDPVQPQRERLQQQGGIRRRLTMSAATSSTTTDANGVSLLPLGQGYTSSSLSTSFSLSSLSSSVPVKVNVQQSSLPQQQLNLRGALNPFPELVFSYTLFLCGSLVVWILYLLLPRGFRKQYCLANRKRYERRVDDTMPAAGYWLPVRAQQQQQQSQQSQHLQQSKPRQAASRSATAAKATTATTATTAAAAAMDPTPPLSPPHHYHTTGSGGRRPRTHPPSPEHPALKKIPPNKILAETMARLQGRGIRLVAHGVHCDPKRVWIRIEEDTASVTWQTEFPRRVPDQSGQVSIVLMRGSLHRIVLKQVLYVDVGKRTHALQVLSESRVPDASCLSLLTQNGSLDLQANSKLERDALVSCFSMILDDVHEEDWRALYEASPEPSLANSSNAVDGSMMGGGGFGQQQTPSPAMRGLGIGGGGNVARGGPRHVVNL